MPRSIIRIEKRNVFCCGSIIVLLCVGTISIDSIALYEGMSKIFWKPERLNSIINKTIKEVACQKGILLKSARSHTMQCGMQRGGLPTLPTLGNQSMRIQEARLSGK